VKNEVVWIKEKKCDLREKCMYDIMGKIDKKTILMNKIKWLYFILKNKWYINLNVNYVKMGL